MAPKRGTNGTSACVIGTLDLVRPLALAGVECALVAPPGSAARRSRFVRDVVEWSDPWKEPERLLEHLLDYGRRQPNRPILFYEGDWDLLLVSRERQRLASHFRFVIPEAALVEDLVDKNRFRALAERLELPVPQSRRVVPGQPLPDDLELSFPVAVKPLTRQDAIWEPMAGGAKAIEIPTAAGLRTMLRQFADAGVELLVQTLIPGPETRIESYHAYFDDSGAVAGEFAGRKIRTYPAAYGHSTALEIVDEPEVLALGRELTARMGVRGVVKLDFKRDPDGRLWLLEVNPRFSLWHHPGARAGVNIPELVYRDLVGLPRPPVGTARPGVRWVYHHHDARAARASGVPLGRWLLWACSCEAKSAVSLTDPAPLLSGALAELRHALQSRGSRKQRRRA